MLCVCMLCVCMYICMYVDVIPVFLRKAKKADRHLSKNFVQSFNRVKADRMDFDTDTRGASMGGFIPNM